jgi:hypothetical protein
LLSSISGTRAASGRGGNAAGGGVFAPQRPALVERRAAADGVHLRERPIE